MSAQDVNTIASRLKAEFIDFDSQENMVSLNRNFLNKQGIIFLQQDFLEYIVEDLMEQNIKYTSSADRYE